MVIINEIESNYFNMEQTMSGNPKATTHTTD